MATIDKLSSSDILELDPRALRLLLRQAKREAREARRAWRREERAERRAERREAREARREERSAPIFSTTMFDPYPYPYILW
jgi:Na+-translocating ferredoxin:NAD+ oxidoreductase RnfC subunit